MNEARVKRAVVKNQKLREAHYSQKVDQKYATTFLFELTNQMMKVAHTIHPPKPKSQLI